LVPGAPVERGGAGGCHCFASSAEPLASVRLLFDNLKYNCENRDIAVHLPSGTRNTMAYDPDGLRVLLQDSTGTKKFVYDNQQYLLETDGSHIITAVQTQEPGTYSNLISQYRFDGSLWLPSCHHYDSLGDTAELTDADENVTDTYEYNAWGELVSQTGSTINPFQYRGRYGYFTNPDTGEVYVIMRTYDPVAGRWTTLDVLRFVDGLNMYLAYFLPNGLDPSGRQLVLGSPATAGVPQEWAERFTPWLPIPPSDPNDHTFMTPFGPQGACVPRYRNGRVVGSMCPGRAPRRQNTPDYSSCDGYDRTIGSKCRTRQCGIWWINDPYPVRAKAVCRAFLQMYDFSDTVKCVADCLGNEEKGTRHLDFCSQRACERLKDHTYCYAACGFVPTIGLPKDGPAVGWGILIPLCRENVLNRADEMFD
jgi:RHS repeat-associated core domain